MTFERVSKFYCPKCKRTQVWFTYPSTAKQAVLEPKDGQLLIDKTVRHIYDYKDPVVHQFQCGLCKHTWPVPEWMDIAEGVAKPITQPIPGVDQPINNALLGFEEMCVKAGMLKVVWRNWRAYLGRRHLALFELTRGFYGFLPYEEEYWRHGVYAGRPRGPANDPDFKKLICEALGLDPMPKCAECDKTWKEHLPLGDSECKFPASKSPTINKVTKRGLPSVYEAQPGLFWRAHHQNRRAK